MPARVRQLENAIGPDRVWETAVERLAYPHTWIRTDDELETLMEGLKDYDNAI